MKQSRFRAKSLTSLGHEIRKRCFGNTRSNAPKATERTQAMLSILPVSGGIRTLHAERKTEEMRDTNKNTLMWLCQTRAVFTASHVMASNLLSNTYPFSFPSFKQGHWVALVK